MISLDPDSIWFGSHKTRTLGLSGLTASVLGRPLQKAEQISDWSRRPLRASQLTYAALDAYVGLEIFMQLRQRARDLGAAAVFARCVAEMVGGKTPKKGSGKGGERKPASMKPEEEEGLSDVQPLLTDPIPPSGLRYRTGIRSVECSKSSLVPWKRVISNVATYFFHLLITYL